MAEAPQDNNGNQNDDADDAVQANPIVAKIFKAIGMGPKPVAPPAVPARISSSIAPEVAAAEERTTAAPPKPKAPRMPPGPLATVVMRNDFYRDGFRNLIKIAVLEAVVIVGLILTLIVYINNSKSEDRYFATTADGRIMQLVPLDRPNMTTAALMSWVAQASTEVMTFGFHDYQRRLQQSSRHFTKSGWESFTSALQKARVIDSVTSLQQVVTAAPTSAPVLLQQGVMNGRYRWVIKLPLQVTYRAAQLSRTDNLALNLVIERVSSLENPNGVGIEQWIANTH